MIPKLKTSMIVTATALMVAGSAFAQDVRRSVEKVAGDVYRFQNNNHYSLVVATDEGAVVLDPLNDDAAGWLKTNLSQVTDKPVTHLIFSHSHDDHASGGPAFVGATVIAHKDAPEDIYGVSPDIRVDGQYVLELGGKRIELTDLGVGHGDDMIAAVIRPENVAFVVDTITTNRVLYRDMAGVDIDGLIKQIETVESLDFEILAGGHGPIGTKADATKAKEYVVELRAKVLAALENGTALTDISMEKYSDFIRYEAWVPLNIEGMAKYLKAKGIAK